MVDLTLITRASPALWAARNSRGRPLPLLIEGAPGVGKTAAAVAATRALAASLPGRLVGLAIFRPTIASPVDIPGVMLFERDASGAARATYSKPALFMLAGLYYCAESGAPVQALPVAHTHGPDAGRPIYAGDNASVTLESGESLTLPVNTGILLLDEFAQASPDTAAALAPVIDEGRAGVHTLPIDWAVWATGNRAQDKSGAKRALAFITNRLARVEIADTPLSALREYFAGGPMATGGLVGEPILARYTRKPGMAIHPALLAWLEVNHHTLFAGVPDSPSQPFATPRSFELLANLFAALCCDEDGEVIPSEDDPDRWRLMLALGAGIVGDSAMGSIAAAVIEYGQLPDPKQVYADPAKAPLPEREDMRLAMAYRLANLATRVNLDATMAYIKRMGHGVMLAAIGRLVIRGVDTSHPSMREFCRAHPDDALRIMALVSRANRKG